MPQLRTGEAGRLLGVSDDTVRRWVESGRLAAARDEVGRVVIDGAELAAFAEAQASAPEWGDPAADSARNRFTGLVVRVTKDGVMAQVDVQAGPFRVVSLMSREAADELGLAPGSVVAASVKATQVVVQLLPVRD
ncbi:MAG: TOBE domain-containing protein [Micromonosporaceae bacterium]